MLSPQKTGAASVQVLPSLDQSPTVARPFHTGVSPSQQPSLEPSDLLEHQFKQMLRDVGIPVLPSQLIVNPRSLRSLVLPYPVLLKPQVYRRESGVVGSDAAAKNPIVTNPVVTNPIVTNPIDAIATSHRLFDTNIHGEYPESLLAESLHTDGVQADFQIGLSLETCPGSQQWLLRGCCLTGKRNPEQPAGESRHYEIIVKEGEFSLEASQQLGEQLGLAGTPLKTLADIFEKMCILLEWLDLRSLTISPLALNPDGGAIALDGSICFSETALERQPQLKQLFSPKSEAVAPVVPLDGNIGVLSNGMGLAMTTVDLLKRGQGRAAAFVSLSKSQNGLLPAVRASRLQTYQTQERLHQALENLARLRTVKLILVNWKALSSSCCEVAETILNYCHRANQHIHLRGGSPPAPFVVRFTGKDAEAGCSLLRNAGIVAVESFEEAIAESIALVKVRRVT